MNIKVEYHGTNKMLAVLDQVKEIIQTTNPEFVHIVIDIEVRD